MMARLACLLSVLSCLAATTRSAVGDAPFDGPRTVEHDGDKTMPLGGWLTAPDSLPDFDEAILVNGLQTSPEEAVHEAACTGDQLGTGVSLVYNASTWTILDLLIALWEKLTCASWSANDATDVVLDEIRGRVAAGKPAYLISYSEGALCVSNALRAYESELEDRTDLTDDQRRSRLGSIHVLTVGGACFGEGHLLSTGWPDDLGSLYHVYHENDLVANLIGPGNLFNWPTSIFESHAYVETYVPKLEPWMLHTSGTLVIE
jgi:hypothetical protein